MLHTSKHARARSAGLFGVALAVGGATLVLSAVSTGTAAAAVQGSITVSPSVGTDATLFGGTIANAQCPLNTAESLFTMEGPGIPPLTAFLGPGPNSGTGRQEFSGASIANLKSVKAGTFASDSVYRIVFNCLGSTGQVLDTYEANMNYTVAGPGGYTITAAALPDRVTSTTLTAAPTPVEQGSPVALIADVTPSSGADNPTGSVEFFNGATSLGIDNTLTADGVGTLSTAALPVGTNNVTAVYTPGAGFTGSTSQPAAVTVSPVAARPTTATLTVTPVSGPAYQAVTLTCAVAAGTFQVAGTANFTDNGVAIGSAPVSGGNPAVLTTSSASAPGAHSYVCNFVGTAPYSNSTSSAVAAQYTLVGPAPDLQTITVTVPVGAITITTPYTPTNPLSLGTAVLYSADSTYSASAFFDKVTITDTRAGNLGFTASLVAGAFNNGASSFPGSHAGFTNVTAVQLAGNAMQASNVIETDTAPFAPGLGTVREFARYAAGLPTGSVYVTATFGVDAVPTSVQPGLYTSTVTFTIA